MVAIFFTLMLTIQQVTVPTDFEKGMEFLQTQQLDSARACFTRVLAANPENDQAYFWRGVTHQESSDLSTAIDDYTAAIEINADPRYYNNRGMCRMLLEELDPALEDFEAANEVDPEYGIAWLNRGFVHFRKGNKDLACEYGTKALDLGLAMARSFTDQACK